jgi:plasmid stabilization system protein ParE
MSFKVHELPRAQADKRQIFVWLFERSPQGAQAWLDAYDQLVDTIETSADSFGEAAENDSCPEVDVKQAFFKTRRGRTYRMLFLIDEESVYVLRVRGPGQAPVDPQELSHP